MINSSRAMFSNALLVMGVFFLSGFVIFEFQGMSMDPLIPALAAFCIASTALLDRIGRREYE